MATRLRPILMGSGNGGGEPFNGCRVPPALASLRDRVDNIETRLDALTDEVHVLAAVQRESQAKLDEQITRTEDINSRLSKQVELFGKQMQRQAMVSARSNEMNDRLEVLVELLKVHAQQKRKPKKNREVVET